MGLAFTTAAALLAGTDFKYVYDVREVIMPTATGRTAIDEHGEFLLLPPEVAFGLDVEVTIVHSGDVLTIYPREAAIAELTEPPERPDR